MLSCTRWMRSKYGEILGFARKNAHQYYRPECKSSTLRQQLCIRVLRTLSPKFHPQKVFVRYGGELRAWRLALVCSCHLFDSWGSGEGQYPTRSAVKCFLLGPAHAVYFGTYEAVKQKLGGNVGSEHHPFAVGMASIIFSAVLYVNIRPTATAGACATIASDALMNPFDG